MKKIIALSTSAIAATLVVVVMVTSSGCPKTGQPSPVTPVVNGIIDCLKTEKTVVMQNVPVLQIGMDVLSALIQAVTTKDFSDAIKQLVAKYTPIAGNATNDIIACAVNKAQGTILAWTGGGGSGSASGSASGSGMMLSRATMDKKEMVDAVIAEHGWKFAN